MKKIFYVLFVGMFTLLAHNVSADSFTSDDFVIMIKSDNSGPSSNTQFEIPTYVGESYNYNVDCDDDGTYESTGVNGNYVCNYPSAGTYTIVIHDATGNHMGFPGINFNNSGDKDKILAIEQWGTSKFTSMENAFYGCTNLRFEADDVPNLSNSNISMKAAFRNTQNLNSAQTSWSSWNTTNAVDMSEMFMDSNFNKDISSWDTSNVTNMKDMFNGDTSFNQDLGTPIYAWNTSQVTNMEGMFKGATSFNNGESGNIHNTKLGWDTVSVTNMKSMFEGANHFNQQLVKDDGSPWNTSNVADMNSMFNGAQNFDQDLGGWSVGSLSDATNMFNGVTLSTVNYNSLLSGWSGQSLNSGVNLNAGNSKYCAQGARDILTNAPNNWNITDGGMETNCPSYQVSIEKVSNGEEPTVNGSFMVSVNPVNTSGTPITGNITYSGTATNGVDYQTGATTFSIPNGASSTTINLDIKDDIEIEGTEDIVVTISNLSSGTISNSTTTLNLFDDDSYLISIEKIINGEEPNLDSKFAITVNPVNTSGTPITGNITYSGTATNGVDYQTGDATFSISNGASSTTIVLNAIDDKLAEEEETIFITISNPSNGIIVDNSITLSLFDDDEVPTIKEITPINITKTTTPNYTFDSNKAGIISYEGDCSSSTINAIDGYNTVTFNPLTKGTHSNCVIKVTDKYDNVSKALHVSSFVVDTDGEFTKTPMFRLYNTKTGAQLYTRGVADKDKILSKFRDFEFTDGTPAFWAYTTMHPGLTPMYRLYNTRTGAQLYTRGDADKNKILAKFKDFEFTDGVPAFYASLTDDGSTPIYRLYNTQTGMQLYTRGEADKNKILDKFKVFEFTDGVPAFYASLTN